MGKRIADEELQGENWNLCHTDNRGWLVAKKLSNGLLTTLQICMVRASQRAISIGLFSFISSSPSFSTHCVENPKSYLGHYRNLLRVTDKSASDWYLNESINEVWSARILDRNIASQYYYRLLQSQNKQVAKTEMEQITAPYQQDKLEFIKNPVVAEFLGLSPNPDFSETKL